MTQTNTAPLPYPRGSQIWGRPGRETHGVTMKLMAQGFYVHITKTGRRVAVSARTRKLLQAHGLAAA